MSTWRERDAVDDNVVSIFGYMESNRVYVRFTSRDSQGAQRVEQRIDTTDVSAVVDAYRQTFETLGYTVKIQY